MIDVRRLHGLSVPAAGLLVVLIFTHSSHGKDALPNQLNWRLDHQPLMQRIMAEELRRAREGLNNASQKSQHETENVSSRTIANKDGWTIDRNGVIRDFTKRPVGFWGLDLVPIRQLR